MFKSVENSAAWRAIELEGRPREVLSISCKRKTFFRKEQHTFKQLLGATTKLTAQLHETVEVPVDQQQQQSSHGYSVQEKFKGEI